MKVQKIKGAKGWHLIDDNDAVVAVFFDEGLAHAAAVGIPYGKRALMTIKTVPNYNIIPPFNRPEETRGVRMPRIIC